MCVGQNTEHEHCGQSFTNSNENMWLEGIHYICDEKTNLCTKGETELPPGAKDTKITNWVNGNSRSMIGDFKMEFNAARNEA